MAFADCADTLIVIQSSTLSLTPPLLGLYMYCRKTIARIPYSDTVVRYLRGGRNGHRDLWAVFGEVGRL